MGDQRVTQASASERVKAAQKALAAYEDGTVLSNARAAHDLAEALRALVTPPPTGESEATIAGKVLDDYFTLTYEEMVTDPSGETVYAALMAAARAATQSAYLTWEPVDRPSQEQMLRWLGIVHKDEYDGDPRWIIPAQIIEKESA